MSLANSPQLVKGGLFVLNAAGNAEQQLKGARHGLFSRSPQQAQ